jgi:DNA-binding winged helix-turn-helix (wHTH) protein
LRHEAEPNGLRKPLTFQFEDFLLDPDRRELRRAGTLVAVEPQVFDLINYLVCNRDRVVSRDNLLDAIWNGRVVSESTLASRINAARRALNDSGGEQRLIRTVARKGVRFVGRVEGSRPAEASSSPVPENADATMRSPLPLPDRPAIAVLPFTNLGGETEQEYFSDGISEDIIMALSKLRWFFVIARNSSFIYKGKAVSLAEFETALQLNPNFALAQGYYGLSLSYSGRWQDVPTPARSN